MKNNSGDGRFEQYFDEANYISCRKLKETYLYQYLMVKHYRFEIWILKM